MEGRVVADGIAQALGPVDTRNELAWSDALSKATEFFYDETPVGLLLDSPLPAAPSRWRYEPYRGPGHYELGTRLDAGQQAWCSYVSGDRMVRFLVTEIPSYGVLQVVESAVGEPVLSRAKQQKIQIVVQANIRHAANLLDSFPGIDDLSGDLPDDPQEARHQNIEQLNKVATVGFQRDRRGGFWRELMRAAESLNLPEAHDRFRREYKAALARVGTPDDPRN